MRDPGSKHNVESERKTYNINFLYPQACTHICMGSPTHAKMFICCMHKLDSKLLDHENFTQENLRLGFPKDSCFLYVVELIKIKLEYPSESETHLCESVAMILES